MQILILHTINQLKKISFLVLVFNFSVLSISCNKLIPAGFWNNFEQDLLLENIGSQGPWGGHRAMYWKTTKLNYFKASKVIAFAKKHGWELVDNESFNENELKSWVHNKELIFPLSSNGFSTVINGNYADFPRWINSDLIVYKFKTGWITIYQGTDDSIEENGFIVINNNGTEMSVYHLWGE